MQNKLLFLVLCNIYLLVLVLRIERGDCEVHVLSGLRGPGHDCAIDDSDFLKTKIEAFQLSK